MKNRSEDNRENTTNQSFLKVFVVKLLQVVAYHGHETAMFKYKYVINSQLETSLNPSVM